MMIKSKLKANDKTIITDTKPSDTFILSNDPKTGIKLHEDVIETAGGVITPLTPSQITCIALNNHARHSGTGKFFWIASRAQRSELEKEGFCSSGPDIVYHPYVWDEKDCALYDDMTPYQKLKLSHAWTCLQPGDIMVAVYHDRSEVHAPTLFPSPTTPPATPRNFIFGIVSLLLLWDH